MEYTKNLQLPLLVPNQSGKEFTHNEALVILDNIIHNGVEAIAATPPTAPEVDDKYIVAPEATGDFSNHANALALYTPNGWRFIEPQMGHLMWIKNKNDIYVFTGEIWQTVSSASQSEEPMEDDRFSISNPSLNQLLIFDGEKFVNSTELPNLTVKNDIAVFKALNNNFNLQLQKNGENSTSQVSFVDNNIAKARIELTENNNLALQVSLDGLEWKDSIIIDGTTGKVSLLQDSAGGDEGNTGSGGNYERAKGIGLNYINDFSFSIHDEKTGSTLIKTIDSWQNGNNAGALDTGTIAADNWYDIYRIKEQSTGNIDYLICKNTIAPLVPSGYEVDIFVNWIYIINKDSQAVIREFTIFDNDIYLFKEEVNVELATKYTKDSTKCEFYTGVPKGKNINAIAIFRQDHPNITYELLINQFNRQTIGTIDFASRYSGLAHSYTLMYEPTTCITDVDGKITIWARYQSVSASLSLTKFTFYCLGFYLPKL